MHQVRTVYAVPVDREPAPRFAAAITSAMCAVQHWYADQLDGYTFSIAAPIPQQCALPGESGYYEVGGDGPWRESGWVRMIDDLQDCAAVRHFSDWDVWVVYPDVDNHCTLGTLGRGGDGVTILHRHDLEGLVDHTYIHCGAPQRGPGGWVGGLAHEIGHAFGLPHPPGCDEGTSDCDSGALMWFGYYHDFPETHLTEDDKTTLRASPFFHVRLDE